MADPTATPADTGTTAEPLNTSAKLRHVVNQEQFHHGHMPVIVKVADDELFCDIVNVSTVPYGDAETPAMLIEITKPAKDGNA